MTTELTLDINDIGGTAEVATLLECPKQQIHALRRSPKFPAPVRTLAATPIWNLSDIREFKSSWRRRSTTSTPAESPTE